MKIIQIKDYFESTGRTPGLDVRSPGEFESGHIPGFKNLPLFSNKERAIIGTTYKQVGPESAMLKGLEISGRKMRPYVENALEIAPEKKAVLHCWRGGKRSASMAWLLDFYGFEISLIEGGYKAYRNFIHDFFKNENLKFVCLGGQTGSGKTEVLFKLEELGEQVIDLEGLARHKGSAFGTLGQEVQPTTEQFENNLFEQLRKLDTSRRIWVENESRKIGTVFIPEGFWQKIKKTTMVELVVPHETRIERLVSDYSTFSKDDLIDSFTKIKKRLGGQNLNAAVEAINEGDFHKAVEIGLDYYDKSYLHAVSKGPFLKILPLEVHHSNPEEVARQLISLEYD